MFPHPAFTQGHRRAAPRLTSLTLTGLTLICLLIGSTGTAAAAREGHTHLSPIAYPTRHLPAHRSGYLMVDEDECDPDDPGEMDTAEGEVDGVTVVCEESHPSGGGFGGGSSSHSGSGLGGGGGGADSSGGGAPVDSGPTNEPTAGIPFYINPDRFDFRPSSDNWQETGCVEVVFGYGTTFLPMMTFKVGVRVGAPLRLRDGKLLGVREAQLDSANAAGEAAGIIKRMLDDGAIHPSEVQPRFVGFMGGAIQSTGLGYRVNGCHPGAGAGSGPSPTAGSSYHPPTHSNPAPRPAHLHEQ